MISLLIMIALGAGPGPLPPAFERDRAALVISELGSALPPRSSQFQDREAGENLQETGDEEALANEVGGTVDFDGPVAFLDLSQQAPLHLPARPTATAPGPSGAMTNRDSAPDERLRFPIATARRAIPAET
jgi:hypothetical protein